jgi:hypothetical protein
MSMWIITLRMPPMVFETLKEKNRELLYEPVKSWKVLKEITFTKEFGRRKISVIKSHSIQGILL